MISSYYLKSIISNKKKRKKGLLTLGPKTRAGVKKTGASGGDNCIRIQSSPPSKLLSNASRSQPIIRDKNPLFLDFHIRLSSDTITHPFNTKIILQAPYYYVDYKNPIVKMCYRYLSIHNF